MFPRPDFRARGKYDLLNEPDDPADPDELDLLRVEVFGGHVLGDTVGSPSLGRLLVRESADDDVSQPSTYLQTSVEGDAPTIEP